VEVSLAGIVVCAGLFILGYFARGLIIVSLISSFAFGSTAIGTIDSLGGASPLVFTVFAIALIGGAAIRRQTLSQLWTVLGQSRVPWVLGFLTIYTIVGAYLLPRLFAGRTNAFVPSRDGGEVFELPLEPVSGNVTQTAYLTLGVLTFLALSALLTREDNLRAVRRGFFVFCSLHAVLGFVDLAGKVLGAGDILMIIRSANYALATNVEEAGFYRIAGGYSEASAFGGITLACLAFTSTYWRHTRSRLALTLSIALLILLLLSTSTTAYVGSIFIAAPFAWSVARKALGGHLSREDIVLAAGFVTTATIILGVYLYDNEVFRPIIDLVDATILNKSSSFSVEERGLWNLQSLQSFLDTGGLGIGLGSSRASSWPIAVISQLGFVGSVCVAVIVLEILKSPGPMKAIVEASNVALHDGVRAFALLLLVAATLSGGGADPGSLFFIALATIMACRAHLRAPSPEDIIDIPMLPLRRYQ
jgi:hypothetical protein